MDEETQTQPEAPQGEDRSSDALKAAGLFAFDFIKVFIIALAIIIPVRFFLFQPFVVTGDSMRPNFFDGDYLVIDELTYRIRNPHRGEVVVMRFPHDPSQFFIKRIIGLPGERVIVSDGQVQVVNDGNPQGAILKEEYISEQVKTYGNVDIILNSDEYFVLGDNRLSSSDSRVWGALPEDNLVGRAYIRLFPLSEFNIFSSPSYNPVSP